jgi:hypothetical protein
VYSHGAHFWITAQLSEDKAVRIQKVICVDEESSQ